MSVGVVGVRVGGLRFALAVGGCLAAVLAAWALWGAGRGAAPTVTHRGPVVPDAARGVVSRTLGAGDRRFFVRQVAGGFAVGGGAGGVMARFSRGGVVVGAEGVVWPLGLRGVGRGGRLVSAAVVFPVAHGNQVRYERRGVSEWYANGPLGLEQGFTLASRPAGAAGAPLTLALGELPEGVRARVAGDRRSVALTRGGLAVLRYRGLFASDARGRALPARIVLMGRALSLQVDDRGARYPVRVDPFVQVAKLTASDAASSDDMGISVAISGNTIVAGAPRVSGGPNAPLQGALYVFVEPPDGWANATETAELTASDGAAFDQLGSSVAISGNTIVAGAPHATIGNNGNNAGNADQGAAYVFVKPAAGGWVSGHEQAKLVAADGTANDLLGGSVAISGATVVAGAFNQTIGGNQAQGAAYVFVKPDGGWGAATPIQAKLTASDGAAGDELAASVAISGDTVVATRNGTQGRLLGAEYVFVEPAGGWSDEHETAKLTAAGGGRIGGGSTGQAVAISGGTIVGAGDNGVYVFVKPVAGWSDGQSTAKLTASDGSAIGWAMAISGDTVVAGAPQANNLFGAVYVFAKPPGGWADEHEAQKITPAPDNPSSGELGYSVGVDAGTIVATAPFEQEGNVGQAGAAYVFTGSVGATHPTSTQVSCSPKSVAVGQAATTCTATVSDTGADPKATPAGTVSFASDSHGAFSNPGASCTLDANGSCHVDYTPAAVDSGTHQLTGTYGGDGAHTGSAGNASLTVSPPAKRATSTSLSCSTASVTNGHTTTCGATVSDTGNGSLVTPTGVVHFSSDSPGTFSGASCTLTRINAASAGCLIQYTPMTLVAGTHTLTGAYAGDGAHNGSIGHAGVAVVTQPVVPINTKLPSIVPSQSCQFYIHRFFCQTIPYQYFCQPGQWVGNDPSIPYRFEWDQLYHTQSKFASPFWRAEPNGSSQTFNPVSHVTPFDILHGYVATGRFRCVVTATGRGGSTSANSPTTPLQLGPSISFPRTPPVNIVVTGIEVTQAVQSPCLSCPGGLLPARDQSRIDTPGQATYQGVTMAAGKWTVVRVYAHVTGGTPATLSGATAQLEVSDSAGNKLFCTPSNRPTCAINPDSSPAQLTQPTCNYCVTPAEAANPGSSFNFLIPWEETYHQSLTFRATVTPRYGFFLPAQCSGCRGNIFTLSSVPFIPTATVPIKPLPLAVGSYARCGTTLARGCTKQNPQQVFGDTTIVMPAPFEIYPYRPVQVEQATENACQAAADVIARDGNDGITVNEYGVGVFYNGEGSMQNGCTAGGFTLFKTGTASVVQDTGRSLTSVTHEIGHGLGLVHADTGNFVGPPVNDNTGPHPDTTPDCGGNSNGQKGEFWPPGVPNGDNEGRLDSWGLDRRAWDIFKTGSLPSTFVEGFDHAGNPNSTFTGGGRYYDFMSYCGTSSTPVKVIESLDWISQFNWNRLLTYYAPANNLPAAADRPWRAVQGTPLRVMAIVDSNGNTSIVHVLPGQRGLGGPTPGSPYRIELRDRSGRVLDSAVPLTGEMHVDFSGKRPELLLDATLRFAPSTGAVTVSAGGQVIARRTRSAHVPTAKFLSPRPGSQLGKTRTTLVRWSARDADRDRLGSTVEYSFDGGRHWTVVADGITGDSARVPSRFLSASRNARLRVLVSDGFDVTTVTSGRLRARGAPPTVQILNAPRHGHVLDTATLLLQGSAFDDADRPITGRHLRWYLGKRLIGTGERVTLSGAKAGNTTIRLVATDPHGRSSQATLPLRVKAVAARYLLLDAPLLVSSRARTVPIRVAASAPATFTIAGRHYAVDPRLRTITIHVRRGKGLLRLPCSLRSPGGVVKGTYIAVRGR